MINRQNLSKFGIGTWGIGGFATKNPDNPDDKQIKALSYLLEKGVNFIETGLWPAEGHCASLISKAYKRSRVGREKIFITETIYPYTLAKFDDIEAEFYNFLKFFNIEYLDSLQFSMETIVMYGLKPIRDLVEMLFAEKKIRYTSVTNANLDFLKKYHKEFGEKLFAHEVGFNFEIRENEDLGITNYALKNNILNIVYQPLRRNRTAQHNYPLLVELSRKHGKTQNQIILNWIVSKGFFPITKSEIIEHIDQHLGAFDFEIEKEDLEKLNSFRTEGYKSPKIDWFRSGDGVTVDQLSNVFDELVKK